MHQWTAMFFVIFRVKNESHLESREKVPLIVAGNNKNHSRRGIPSLDGKILFQRPDEGPGPPASSRLFDLYLG